MLTTYSYSHLLLSDLCSLFWSLLFSHFWTSEWNILSFSFSSSLSFIKKRNKNIRITVQICAMCAFTWHSFMQYNCGSGLVGSKTSIGSGYGYGYGYGYRKTAKTEKQKNHSGSASGQLGSKMIEVKWLRKTDNFSAKNWIYECKFLFVKKMSLRILEKVHVVS